MGFCERSMTKMNHEEKGVKQLILILSITDQIMLFNLSGLALLKYFYPEIIIIISLVKASLSLSHFSGTRQLCLESLIIWGFPYQLSIWQPSPSITQSKQIVLPSSLRQASTSLLIYSTENISDHLYICTLYNYSSSNTWS